MVAAALPKGGYGTLSMSTLLLLFKAAWARLTGFGTSAACPEAKGDVGTPAVTW